MSDLVTIASFQFENQAVIAKGLLASEGIDAYIKDGINSTIYISVAVGGVKLQVRDRDVDDAVKILRSDGILEEYEDEDNSVPEGLQWVNEKTAFLPFLKKIPLLPRVFLLMVALASVIALIVKLSSL